MSIRKESIRLAFCGAALLALTACGGGGGGGDGGTAAVATTDVKTTVVDGAIKNAVVCLDKNGNGVCDSDEVQGRTDANGVVTLAIPDADVGKYPIIAMVGLDATDADHGAVPQAYTMSAPADQAAVVSPLTTLVQQTIATTGATTADAAKVVQQATGINVSLFQDFTKAAAPTDGSADPAVVARMLVVTTQQQSGAVAGTVGTAAVDGTVVTQADLDKAVQKELLLLLPALVTALNDPAVQAATTPAAKEAALAAAAAAVLANSGLTSASVPTVVAINNQVAAPPVATPTTAASFELRSLTFSDANNYLYQVFTGSAAQNTPDANGNMRYVDRHIKASAGNVAKWGGGSSPVYGSTLHWNGSAWTNCPINFENISGLRDAQGSSVYNYCDGVEVGKNERAAFDVSGRTMASVYAQIRGAGYTSLTINDPSLLGTDVFPSGSSMYFMTSTAFSTAISYYPAGANNPVGSSNLVTQYSPAVSAGGDASSQGAGVACNAAESSTRGANSTTLEGLVAAMTGTPCRFKPNTFVYGGVAYSSGDTNEWWGNSTVSVGKIGSAPVGNGTAPGYYTTNTLLRAAFTGSGTNAVTYYACQERFNTGSVRNCTAIGTGTYTITTYGDGRALTFNNLPAQTAALTYDTVLVERAGLIYFGYQNKPGAFKKVRLNTVASAALMTKLGLPIEDPNVPLALTAGSYQGTWDFSGSTNASGLPEGISIFVNDTGTLSCEDQSTGQFYTCTLTVADPGTGAFTLSGGTNTLSGTFDFLTGTARGNFQDAKSAPPTTGTFVGGRR